jgi:hypothetical protein
MMFQIKPVENDETAELSVTMLNAGLSCRGKTGRSSHKRNIHKDPPSEGGLYQDL